MQTVALVGESGCGKSTAISLLQRFYNPDSGHIFLDGIDIQSYQLSWLRRQMGLVGQEPILFNESIRDNIAYGKHGKASEAEIIAAAQSANAHKFISNLQQVPNVYTASSLCFVFLYFSHSPSPTHTQTLFSIYVCMYVCVYICKYVHM